MSISGSHDAKKIARAFVEAYCAGDAGWTRELLADGFVWHLAGAPNVMGRDDWLRGLENGKGTFATADVRVEQIVAEPDRVAMVLAIEPAHTAAWTLTLDAGKIAELWVFDENFTLKLRRAA